jgi:glycogen debranching enzyme
MARYALKYGSEFLVADALGDITGEGEGLYFNDTRLLSRLALTFGGAIPSLLSSGVSQDNVFFRANLTNRPLPELGERSPPEGAMHVERTRFLWDRRLYERIALTNYALHELPVTLRIAFAADFADIFEVRGHVRSRHGRILDPELRDADVRLAYEGVDAVVRACVIAFSPRPDRLSPGTGEFTLTLAPRARIFLHLEIGTETAPEPGAARFRAAAAQARLAMRRKRRRGASVQCPRGPFQIWVEKSRADLALLTTDLPSGPYPYAGIPWFSTPFGRDGIITALQMLWLDATLARGVLQYLADHQAHATSAFDDAAPGKILHETRASELAAVGEVPFRHYYGGVDTTPLFVMLAGAYARRTGDLDFIDKLWPALDAAMAWIDGPGDSNGDGFVDYARANQRGLVNQGWKDSTDSIFHDDGRMAEQPIALIEVQGYVYAARLAMSWLAKRRGQHDRAREWQRRAKALRVEVERRFWLPDLGFYAIAIDGSAEPCRIRASNPGHLLYTGLPSPQRAARVAAQFLSAAFDSGWGIRTLAQDQVRFNPMSYHDGTVWPHDTALCAAGIAAYGNRGAAAHLASELFAAAIHFGMRLPELYCGFVRSPGEPPVGYPVACLPQAWSSGAAFMVLQASLGVSIDGINGLMRIDRPALPAEVERLALRELAVGDARVDVVFQRLGDRVTAAPMGPVPASVKILVRP